MNDYFELRNQLQEIQKELESNLASLVEKYGYDKSIAWFNFNNDTLYLIWSGTFLPKKLLDELEIEFGEVECVHSTNLSPNIQVQFAKGERNGS